MTTLDPLRLAQAFQRNTAMAQHPARGDAFAAAPSSDGTTADVWLYGVIGSYFDGLDAAAFAEQITALDVQTINLRVHSPGGSVFDGLAILNALRSHPAKVVVTVDGLAASAASFIAMAGDEIRMSQGSQLMVHDAWGLAIGNAAVHRDMADWLDKQSQNIADVYASRAGGSAASWRAAMTAETWYTAQEAVDAGLADVVLEAPAPPAAEQTSPAAAAAMAFDLTGFTYAGRASAPAPMLPAASAGGSYNTEGGSAVAFSNEQITTLRATLGLPETADEATIVAAVNAVVEDTLEDQPTATAAAASIPEGMSLVEDAVLAELRQGAAAGREAQATLQAQARDAAIDAAVREGRITPARRQHWAAAYDADPEGTRDLLASLAPGLVVPTDEAGHGLDADATKAKDELDIDDAEIAAFARALGLNEEAIRG